MSRRRRGLIGAGVSLGSVLLLALVALFVLTQTDWGRERVRRFAVTQLERMTDGHVEIATIEGNLLRGIRLIDVSITDLQRRPFVTADTLAARFSFRALLRRRIALGRVRLVGTELVLDRPPGEAWNYVRIFRIDPDRVPVDPTRPRWGDWISLHEVAILNSRVLIRTAWRPPEDLTGPERERALERALAGDTRDYVVEVPGGYQNLMDFRNLTASLPRVLIAHPDSAGIPIEVAHLSGIVQPFQPPEAIVHDLSGKVRIEHDSLFFTGIRAQLPDSRIAADGVYALHSGDLLLRLRGAPVAFNDVRWLYPPLPEQGGGTALVTIVSRTLVHRIIAEEMDLAVGDATLEGRLDLTTGDTLRLGETNLRFARLPTAFVTNFLPALEFPRRGLLTGRLALLGPPDALRLDGDVVFADAAGGSSRVIAVGEVGLVDDVRFRNLRLRFAPLQAGLARAIVRDLPVQRGTIEGYANLTGRVDGALQLDSDLTIRDARTGLSRVAGAGGIVFGDEVRFNDLRLRLNPLRADLVRDRIPFLPPGATITGPLRLDGVPTRALAVAGELAVDDPRTGTSRVAGSGGLVFGDELRVSDLELRLDPLRLDVLGVRELPAGATLVGRVHLDGVPQRALRVDGDVALHDPESGTSHFGATGGLVIRDAFRFDELQLRLHAVQVDLLRHELPDLPPGGLLTGSVRLDGPPSGMLQVNGQIAHDDAQLGTSRIAASGGIRFADALQFRALDLELRPLSMALVRGFAPDLPLGGTLAGNATLDGAPATRLAVRGDLVHEERGERSHVVGSADIVPGPGGRAAIDVSLQPLSLAVAGRFVPQAGLRGSVAGSLSASGDLGDLRIATDLRVAGDGAVRADGSVDLASAQPGYDLNLRMQDFDLAAVSYRAPAVTSLTGVAFARGRGVEPATMTATIHADLRDPSVDALAADHVLLRVQLADGLATIDSSVVRLGTAEAVLDGTFGLVATRTGTLAYRVAIDSLHAFSPWLPVEIEAPPPPVIIANNNYAGDHLEPVAEPRDTLAGSLYAAGTLRGNVERFDVDGRADVENLAFDGSFIGRARADYEVIGVGTAQPAITLAAGARTLDVGGLAFDSAAAWIQHQGDRFGSGRAIIAAYQNDEAEYYADAEFALSLEHSELRLADLTLRFDTVTWRMAQPSLVSWGGDGVEVAHLDLVSDAGGRVLVDGRLPTAGEGDFEVRLQELEIGQIAKLLQDDRDATGIVDLDARVQGTLREPRMGGTFALRDATLDGSALPDLRTSFVYAQQRLELDGELFEDGRHLAIVQASLPIDLALTPDVDARLLPGELAIDVQADSLSIEALPGFTDVIEDVQGRVTGTVAIRGTVDTPVLAGDVDLDLGSMHVVPLGVTFEDVAGAVSMAGTTIRVDSLVATSRGELRVTGTINVGTLMQPEFDLAVVAEDARILDIDDARFDVDAELQVTGSLAAIEVTGDVRTRRGVLHIPPLSELGGGEVVNLDDPGTFQRMEDAFSAERERFFARSTLLDNLELDVGLVIDRNVWVRSTETNIEVYTPPEVGPLRVRMSGEDRSLAAEGTLNTDRGEYEFMSRRFRLTRGAATFVGGPEINPLIQVAAEHEVQLPGREVFQIRVGLSGELRDIQVTLESTAQPPISQTDLLSYIAFGRDASSLLAQQGSALSGQGGSGDLVGNVAALATQQLAAVALEAVVNELEVGAMQALGVDVFRITPADIPAELFTGELSDIVRGTEVEAGRYVTDRLFVAGQLRGGTMRPGLRLEYGSPRGFQWRLTWMPRFLPLEPTLTERDVSVRSVLGAFLFREWRF